ncbi:hypothetical protein [Desulfothermobacter acidiphilus]|uniref:hypothetical protein n=1 Tax=Desulfothermobacter acidiphilus TaxID=1938353 RepID=UPI003F89C1AB
MYRWQEIQDHLNRLRQEISNIGQMVMQLSQIESQAQSQLARLSQTEGSNSQQLQRIHQMCLSLHNEINALSSTAQSAMPGQWSAMGTPTWTPGMNYGSSMAYQSEESGMGNTSGRMEAKSDF